MSIVPGVSPVFERCRAYRACLAAGEHGARQIDAPFQAGRNHPGDVQRIPVNCDTRSDPNPLMVGLTVGGAYLDGHYAAWDDLDRMERKVDYAGTDTLPDETTILNFRHLLQTHRLSARLFAEVNALLAEKGLLLREGTTVDATLIAAPPSTKNQDGKRDPEMTQTKKGNQWHFGMKAHIGVDDASGLVHTVVGTTAKVSDMSQFGNLLHGDETRISADRGYDYPQIHGHLEENLIENWVARKAKPGKSLDARTRGLNHAIAKLRAIGEHPFRILKRQFGYTKVRYRGLAKNTAQLETLFALGNLYQARRALLVTG